MASVRAIAASPKHPLPVVPQLLDRLADVVERQVLRGLLQSGEYIGCPAASEFLQRADVEVPVMEKLLERRHFPCEEPSVLADAVAAHRRGARLRVLMQELEGLQLRVDGIEGAATHPVRETRLAVRPSVPVVHPRKHRLGLVNGDHRPFGDQVQLGVGHDRGDLDDVVDVRVQPGHFEVDPDEVVGLGRHDHGPE